MAKNGVKSKIDIAILQERIENLDMNVQKILDNHIPHIHDELDKIKIRIAYWTGGTAAIGIIIQTILYFHK